MPMTIDQANSVAAQMRAERERQMRDFWAKQSAKANAVNQAIGTAPIVTRPVLGGPGGAMAPAPMTRMDAQRSALAAERAAKAKRDAEFSAWKASTQAKQDAYDRGDEVRLGVNNQIVARKSPEIEKRRREQDIANAMRRRAEIANVMRSRGKQMVYGTSGQGSMAIAANAPAPSGFSSIPPALGGAMPRTAGGAVPPVPVVPASFARRPPTQVTPDSDFAPQLTPDQQAVVDRIGGAVRGFMGRIPTTYGGVLDAMGFKKPSRSHLTPLGESRIAELQRDNKYFPPEYASDPGFQQSISSMTDEQFRLWRDKHWPRDKQTSGTGSTEFWTGSP